MDTPFSKTLPDGRSVSVAPALTVFGALYFTAMDTRGRQVASGELGDAAQRGVPADRVPSGCTHWLGGPEPVWFTFEEAGRLAELGDAALRAFAESQEGHSLEAWRREQGELAAAEAAATAVLRTPDGMALAAERDRLRAKARGILDADDAQREAAYESGEPGHYYRQQKPQNDAAYDAARAALGEFDEQHPEIAAALTAAKAAAERRFLEHD
ncbi:hypothetical protein [Kitasatospora purpeofusca]|uniref:hypothetical protein n=1 Tax=Kitasatospora purpeofusca TaxID=67352 RepID=UPI00381F648E